MTVVRVKGLKRYRAKGRWYAYHRKTGIRLKSEFGTGDFFTELAEIERKLKSEQTLPGTLGLLISAYRASPAYVNLAASTRRSYAQIMNLVKPLQNMPLVELTPPFIAGLRDRIAENHGRRQANYVMAVMSVACQYGREQGLLQDNPVKGVKRLKRPHDAVKANRPWTEQERRIVLAKSPTRFGCRWP